MRGVLQRTRISFRGPSRRTASICLLRAACIARAFLEAYTHTDAATAPRRVLRKAARARTGPRSLLTRSATRDQRQCARFVRSWFTIDALCPVSSSHSCGYHAEAPRVRFEVPTTRAKVLAHPHADRLVVHAHRLQLVGFFADELPLVLMRETPVGVLL